MERGCDACRAVRWNGGEGGSNPDVRMVRFELLSLEQQLQLQLQTIKSIYICIVRLVIWNRFVPLSISQE